MKHIIARWRDARRHGGSTLNSQEQPLHRAIDPDRDEREVARKLAEAIERAIRVGLWEHAQRIAGSATTLAKNHPHLAEWLARLRLAQGDPDTAIAIIDSCASFPASLRLLRAICLLQLGRCIEAHMDLHHWAGKSSAPLPARLILALLEWQSGDSAAAVVALQRNLKQFEDPLTLAVLTLISAAEDRSELAANWSQRLRSACAWNDEAPHFDVMLRSMGFKGIEYAQASPDRQHINALAIELLANEQVIPALVEAQGCRPRPALARVLQEAVEVVLPDLEDRSAGFEALARLALVLDQHAQASEWVARGLEHNPLSASLARLQRELNDPQSSQGNLLNKPDVLATIGEVKPARNEPAQEQAA